MILQLKEIVNNKVITTGNKELYNADKNAASKWIRKEVNRIKREDSPPFTNAISYKTYCKQGSYIVKNAIGCFLSNSNNVDENTMCVALYSGAITKNAGISIIPENFRKAIALFAARVSTIPTWINTTDEYLIPKYK